MGLNENEMTIDITKKLEAMFVDIEKVKTGL